MSIIKASTIPNNESDPIEGPQTDTTSRKKHTGLVQGDNSPITNTITIPTLKNFELEKEKTNLSYTSPPDSTESIDSYIPTTETKESIQKQEIENSINEATWKNAVKAAQEEGIAIGIKQGESNASEKMAAQSNALLKQINDLAAYKKDILEKAEPTVIDLALAVAEKITAHHVKENPELFQKIVKEALDRVVSSDEVIIRVNKADIETLRSQKELLKSSLNQIQNIRIQEDSTMAAGGCIVETDFGYIDSSIETKVHIIKKALQQVSTDS